MRRVFSRSELRRLALDKHDVPYFLHPERPRVTKWSFCGECGCIEPRYSLEVDHVDPVVGITESLEDLTWDQVVNRLWCSIDKLNPICKPCHKRKSKEENKERRAYRKANK